MKILGLMPLVASGAYFVPEPWQWLPAAGVGVAVWITFLGRAFLRAARR